MIQALPPPRDARGQVIDLEPISGLLDLISRAWHPKAVRLFGSRAKGLAKPESDWDLFVVVPDDEPAADDLMAVYELRRRSGGAADLILCRVSDFEDARDVPNTLAYEAAHFGVPIRPRSHRPPRPGTYFGVTTQIDIGPVAASVSASKSCAYAQT